MRHKKIIGRVKHISLVKHGIDNVPAKIDTGAFRSSVWASDIIEKEGVLTFKLFAPESEFYTGEEVKTEVYKQVEIESSFGHRQVRYSIFLNVDVSGTKIKSNFTLADRQMKTYPLLIGRKLLKDRFIVDVSFGKTLPEDEEEPNIDNLN